MIPSSDLRETCTRHSFISWHAGDIYVLGPWGKFTWVIRSFCRIHSVVPRYLIDSLRIWNNKTHEGRCVTLHFKVKGRRSRSNGLLEVFAVSAPWLCVYLTDSLHMWHKYNPWSNDVSRTTPRPIDQRSRSWLHMCHKCNTWGGDVSRTIFRSESRSHGSFEILPCPLPGSMIYGGMISATNDYQFSLMISTWKDGQYFREDTFACIDEGRSFRLDSNLKSYCLTKSWHTHHRASEN